MLAAARAGLWLCARRRVRSRGVATERVQQETSDQALRLTPHLNADTSPLEAATQLQ